MASSRLLTSWLNGPDAGTGTGFGSDAAPPTSVHARVTMVLWNGSRLVPGHPRREVIEVVGTTALALVLLACESCQTVSPSPWAATRLLRTVNTLCPGVESCPVCIVEPSFGAADWHLYCNEELPPWRMVFSPEDTRNGSTSRSSTAAPRAAAAGYLGIEELLLRTKALEPSAQGHRPEMLSPLFRNISVIKIGRDAKCRPADHRCRHCPSPWEMSGIFPTKLRERKALPERKGKGRTELIISPPGQGQSVDSSNTVWARSQ